MYVVYIYIPHYNSHVNLSVSPAGQREIIYTTLARLPVVVPVATI